MAALPNTGGALYLTPQSLADAHYYTAKTRNPLKYAVVPQTRQLISAASGLKFATLWGHVEDILELNNFFRLSISLLVATIQPDKLCDGAQMAIFCVVFASCISSERRAAHFRRAF